MWPTPSSSSSRAPGIAAAIASPLAAGSIRSAVPWITSVGAAISPRRALVSWPPIACIWAMITATATGLRSEISSNAA